MSQTKLVIFGGGFDPIHNGHLYIAQLVAQNLHSQILFMPTNKITTYKGNLNATNTQRLHMLELAIRDKPNFKIDTREIDAKEYWYSYKTLTTLRKEYGPNTAMYFIIGADALIGLTTWEYWNQLLSLTNFIIINRTGYPYNLITDTALNSYIYTNTISNLTLDTQNYGKCYFMDITPPNISSTAIRQLVQSHQSISNYVPSTVAQYIHTHQIYQ